MMTMDQVYLWTDDTQLRSIFHTSDIPRKGSHLIHICIQIATVEFRATAIRG